ncbi:MAG: hypothetical protein ACI8RD_009127 [Bacillariaceae sp.]|jgi:hypothetical protein
MCSKKKSKGGGNGGYSRKVYVNTPEYASNIQFVVVPNPAFSEKTCIIEDNKPVTWSYNMYG